MAGSTYLPLNAVQTRRRLRLGLWMCGALLVLPVGFLIVRIYQQLRTEAFYQYQAAAIEVVTRLNERVYEVLKPESERSFDQYGFWSVPQNALVPEDTLNVSPLAQLAPKTTVPGVIGYFQIDPDGSFHSPVLPELNVDLTSRSYPLSENEVARRVGLKSRLRALLSDSHAALAKAKSAREMASRDSPPTLDASDPGSFEAEGEGRANRAGDSPPSKEAAVPQPKKIDDLKLDEGLYRRQQSLPPRSDYDSKLGVGETKAFSQIPRKETLRYLADGRAPSEKDASRAKVNERLAAGKEHSITPTAPAASAQASPSVRQLRGKIEQFEGEIYPIEFEILPDGDFSFYRKVWHDRRRYVQGFVVNANEFLRDVFESVYRGSALRDRVTMIVSYQDKVLRRYGSEQGQGGVLVFRSPLAFPLGAIDLIFSSDGLALGAGTSLVNAVAAFLGLLIPGVLYGVYRLGSAQIALAQERSNFVSAVSHELKTPLTSIRMYGEILRSGWVESEEKKRSYYDYIFFESERLSRLIANVLQLARLANHDSTLALISYSPQRLLEITCSKVRSQVEAAGFAIEVSAGEIPAGLVVLAEEDAFSRIFINLVDNAIKFSRGAERKLVEIGYRVAGEKSRREITFFVRDFGPGIDRTQQRKLFQLFYRGENELTRTTPGTGIGLALVKELAAKMGARVDLESKDPGVELSVRFPGSFPGGVD